MVDSVGDDDEGFWIEDKNVYYCLDALAKGLKSGGVSLRRLF
jgi:hypothetical protein